MKFNSHDLKNNEQNTNFPFRKFSINQHWKDLLIFIQKNDSLFHQHFPMAKSFIYQTMQLKAYWNYWNLVVKTDNLEHKPSPCKNDKPVPPGLSLIKCTTDLLSILNLLKTIEVLFCKKIFIALSQLLN